MRVEQVVERVRQQGFKVRDQGGKWRGQCPCHAGEDLNAEFRERVGGGVEFHCYSHDCSINDLAAAIEVKIAELLPPTNGRGPEVGKMPWGEIVATYVYRDERGEPLFEVCRTADKQFPQRLPGATKWGIGSTRRVLFGLPELLQTQPGETVALCEGEKDVLNLRRAGLAASCNSGGADRHGGKWKEEYTAWLKAHLPGREFLIFADQDEAGIGHAAAVCRSLTAAGVPVRCADLEGLAKGEDISDWLGRHTAAELAALVHPPPPEPRFKLLTFQELCARPKPREQIEGFCREKILLQVFGETNHGKSLFCWDLACATAGGMDTWFGRDILLHGPVVWINADGGEGLVLRAQAWREVHGEPSEFPLLTLMGSIGLNREDQMAEFQAQILGMDERPVFVFFDTQSRCMVGARENDVDEMTRVTEGLHRLKQEVGCTVVPLHHTDKTGQWERGSGVVKNEADSQIRVTKDECTGIYSVKCVKVRDGVPFPEFYFTVQPVLDSVVIVQSGEGPPRDPSEEKAAKQHELTRLVIRQPGITCAAAAEEMGITERTVRRYAENLSELGVLIRVALPHSGEGKAPWGLFPNPGAKG